MLTLVWGPSHRSAAARVPNPRATCHCWASLWFDAIGATRSHRFRAGSNHIWQWSDAVGHLATCFVARGSVRVQCRSRNDCSNPKEKISFVTSRNLKNDHILSHAFQEVVSIQCECPTLSSSFSSFRICRNSGLRVSASSARSFSEMYPAVLSRLYREPESES